ncbi:vacuolar protein sorting-associated protein 52 homolog [Chironomus tepperi]|uniref:vacuolar protein sorting-associated protein 52 homolog n=1 Tax=Chironomus tepperi TaxID=113505 RepID=UPI00391F9179
MAQVAKDGIREQLGYDESLNEVLQSGKDLREYSKEIEKELKIISNKSIHGYIQQAENISKLHNQIGTCDNILQNMEDMLTNFQQVLNNISSEITILQKKSVNMSQQLTNRCIVKNQLYQFIEDMAIPEEMIKCIMENSVTDKDFLKHLNELNHKLSMVKELNFKESKSAEDVEMVLEKLKIKAMSKLRGYLLEQIYKLRIPMTNYQVHQNAMLKYKFFFEFILLNERHVAEEICCEYVDTMSKIYYSYFKSYSTRLNALKFEEAVTKDDLMGIEDTASKSSLFAKTASLKQKSTVFTIGNRGDILTSELEAPIIIPHAQQKTRYPFEALFRSEQYALVDNACREYLFVTEFYLVRGNQAQELFNQIMGKTMSLMMKNLETYIVDCYDTISLFLCIQLILRYQIMCHKRCTAVLDKYWETLQSALWPRFEYLFRLNIQSIRDCDPTKFGVKEIGPHYITRRYGEFSAAIVGITENFPNETVSRLLLELQNEVECFMLRMAAIFPQRKEQLIYLINNYDLILGILQERTRDNTKEAEAFREQLSARSNEYVEEILSPHIGGIIQFVKECEKENSDDLKRHDRRALGLVQNFSSNWKKAIEDLNREVLLSFPSLVTGQSLLQLALAQIVHYYNRFHKLLSPSVRAELVNVHLIMVEIKKYKSNY